MSEVEKQLQSSFPFVLLDNLKLTHGNVCHFAPAVGKECTNAQLDIHEDIFRVVTRNLFLNVLPITAI
jgi:hypothetical protein